MMPQWIKLQECLAKDDMQFNPIYNAQWKETGEWQQTYYAYPEEGYVFDRWTEAGEPVSTDPELQDDYGNSRVLTAHFRQK